VDSLCRGSTSHRSIMQRGEGDYSSDPRRPTRVCRRPCRGHRAAQGQAGIETRLTNLQQATGVQVVVVTVSPIDNDTIEQAALSIGENWHVGVKGADNGAIIMVAVNERKWRIETGYGMGGLLTDHVCGRAGSLLQSEGVGVRGIGFKTGEKLLQRVPLREERVLQFEELSFNEFVCDVAHIRRFVLRDAPPENNTVGTWAWDVLDSFSPLMKKSDLRRGGCGCCRPAPVRR
jgi:hypothetical protein